MMIRSMLAMMALGTAVWTGCGPVDNLIDCNTICNRYKTCYDSNYDVGACQSRCQNQANSNSAYQTQINQCYNCIGGRSCISATFNCGSECSSVVP